MTLIVPAALLVAAMLLVSKGLTLDHRERLLSRRLRSTKGRVTDRGDQQIVSTFTESDGSERRDVTYEGRYVYRVGDREFAGAVTAAAPVFTTAQLPPSEIDVFYDPTEPSVSRLSATPVLSGHHYVRFGLVLLAVALCVTVVPYLDRWRS